MRGDGVRCVEWLLAASVADAIHLILDHTSMEIVVHELRALMQNAHAAREPSSYRTFVTAARAARRDPSHEAFFRDMFATSTTDGAVWRPRARSGASLPARATVAAVGPRTSSAVARAKGVSTAALFHLAWAAVVLAQVSSRPDVACSERCCSVDSARHGRRERSACSSTPCRCVCDWTAVHLPLHFSRRSGCCRSAGARTHATRDSRSA